MARIGNEAKLILKLAEGRIRDEKKENAVGKDIEYFKGLNDGLETALNHMWNVVAEIEKN